MKAPKNIDDYLATVAPLERAALLKLRRTIRRLLPGAEECISYSMPAFRHQGQVVAGFLARKRGCSYYPFSGTTLGTLGAALDGYDRTKSAVHFEPARPLPSALVAKLLKARIAETEADRSAATRRAEPAPAKRRNRPAPAGKRPARARARSSARAAGSARAGARAAPEARTESPRKSRAAPSSRSRGQ